MLFVPQLPLAWQSQGRESMVIHVHPDKFRKNQKISSDHNDFKELTQVKEIPASQSSNRWSHKLKQTSSLVKLKH